MLPLDILHYTFGLVASHFWACDITPLADDITHVTRRPSNPLLHTAVAYTVYGIVSPSI
jgi:hypothetical protein